MVPIAGPLCIGRTLSLTFTATGTYRPDNVFTVYLPDASRSFSTAQPLGTVKPFERNSFPLSVTLMSGTYQLLVRSSSPVISSAASLSVVMGWQPVFSSLLPSLPDRTDTRIDLRVGSTQNSNAYYILTSLYAYAPAQQVRDGLASNGLLPLRLGMVPLQANQPISTTIGGLMPGLGYGVYVVFEEPLSGCLSDVVPLNVVMTGTPASYCFPQYSGGVYYGGCTRGDVIADFILQGTALNRTNLGCSYNNYDQLTENAYQVRATANYGFIFRTYLSNRTSYRPQHIAIWLDANRDGTYSADEQLYKSTGAITSNQWTGTLTMPPIVKSGLYRMRVRCRYNSEVNSPCEYYDYGEAEDYILDVSGLNNLADVSLRMSVDSRVTAANQPVTYQVVVRNDGQQPASNILIGS